MSAAAQLSAGVTLAWAGVIGAGVALYRRRIWPILLLGLPTLFYIWSLYSTGQPIFVPHLWPNSYYNTRYGTTAIPFLAVGSAALIASSPVRFRRWAAAAVVAIAVVPWLFQSMPESWIVWKESQVNSEGRRAWTRITARFLQQNYHRGEGIFTGGDLMGIYREAGIPMREILHEGNNPYWNAAERRADLFLFEKWAVTFSGDPVATAIQRANRRRPLYELETRVIVPGAQAIEIYRRTGGSGAVADLCRKGLISPCESPQAGVTEENDEDSVH